MAAQIEGVVPAAPTRLRRILAAIEPWYSWGTINIERFDTTNRNGDGVDYGDVAYFDLQWFGLHLGFQIGRVPRKGGR